MNQRDTLLIVIRSAPHAGIRLRESLDALLVGAAFGRPVVPLFMGQGVLALLPGQTPGAPGQKSTLPIIQMLEMYDIETLYLAERDVTANGLSQADFVASAKTLDAGQVQALFRDARHVLTF
jgi:tRNA 2-thiouridine synthesizing protein C